MQDLKLHMLKPALRIKCSIGCNTGSGRKYTAHKACSACKVCKAYKGPAAGHEESHHISWEFLREFPSESLLLRDSQCQSLPVPASLWPTWWRAHGILPGQGLKMWPSTPSTPGTPSSPSARCGIAWLADLMRPDEKPPSAVESHG